MAQLRTEIGRVADTLVPILVLGETGTGKERVARALHAASPRAKGPFVAVNMATLPTSMAASQLFGHSRGAFSGADRDHRGFFSQAHGGTLFLDEIGETPAEVQPMLLRILEDSLVRPLGSSKEEKVDVRVIAATDADLAGAIAQGEFRAPLLHRLAGYQIATPPLRERRDDIGRLLYHFLGEELRALGERDLRVPESPQAPMWVPTSLVCELVHYDWPGNVRELRNLARRLVLLGRGRPTIEADANVRTLFGRRDAGDSSAPALGSPDVANRGGRSIGDDELLAVLARNRWQTSKTARDLGISKATLYQLMEKCPGIRTAKELGREEIEASLAACGGDIGRAADELRVSERGLKLRMTDLGLG